MMMNRTRLALLAACAILSTSIQAPGWMRFEPVSRPESSVAQALPSVSSGPPVEFVEIDQSSPAQESVRNDTTIHADLLRRLSSRHTGLAERGRIRVAEAIIREARLHDLDPDLVIAVIEVESAGYHLAISHVGAMGLMQLLPSTGKELAGKLDIEWMGDDTLYDPVINIKLGTAYLRQLADHYGGDVNVALAAYNWGPGRIDRRLRRGAKVPSKYIKQVMQAYDRSTTLASRSS
jgi:soluble lytic murein transglycosylase-like protein